MANPEHLKILKHGIEVWNKWRKENPNIVIDLSGAVLHSVDLKKADFWRVDLKEAVLSEVSLNDADLSFADLSRADLNGADLSGARLMGVNLSEANLKGAGLMRTSLLGAILIDTNFENTQFFSTLILDCSTLSRAKNLDKTRHLNGSKLDVSTLRTCVSELPYSFLQGVGYTNEEIEYLKAQYSKSIQYYSCFISYSSKDEEFAKDLHSKLRDSNITVWFAPEDFKIGDKIRDRINEQIRIYDKLLIVLSENSVKSPWVKYEVETALNREIKENKTILFPIRLDDSIFGINESWANDIQSRHIGDFRNWKNHDDYKKSLERLIKDLKADQK